MFEAGTSTRRPELISQTNASVIVSARLAWSLAPPALTIQLQGLHTHTQRLLKGGEKLRLRRRCTCARNQGQKDEDMNRGQDRTKVYVRGCDEKGTKCTGTKGEPNLITRTWAT